MTIDRDIFDRLAAEAQAQGRTTAEVAAMRIGRTFVAQDAFDGENGKQMRDLAQSMALNFYVAGSRAAGDNSIPADKWMRDPDCFRAAIMAVMSTLMDLHTAPIAEKRMIYESLQGRAATAALNFGRQPPSPSSEGN